MPAYLIGALVVTAIITLCEIVSMLTAIKKERQ